MPVSQIQNASLASGVPGRANLPTGSVLQVINVSNGTQVTSTTSTYADTGLSATITPISSTSRILVTVHQTGLFKQASATRITLRLLRNATSLIVFEWGAGTTDTDVTISPAGSGVTFLDSPATISAVTYKTQFASTNNSSNVRVNLDNNSSSTITLMEIAG